MYFCVVISVYAHTRHSIIATHRHSLGCTQLKVRKLIILRDINAEDTDGGRIWLNMHIHITPLSLHIDTLKSVMEETEENNEKF